MNLPDSKICASLVPYGISADSLLCERIRAYITLLLRWNERISLTTVTDPSEILRFHFGESLFAASTIPIRFGRLADVGSGAGFPGIPLAIACPELDVTLIESNLKKSAFLSEVIRSLNLTNARTVRSRMSDSAIESHTLDFISSRAVGQFADLLAWASGSLTKSGQLVLWISGDEADAVTLQSGWNWRDRILMPGSRNRFLLAGSPSRSD